MARGKEVEAKRDESRQPSPMCPEGLRVLVVDDDPFCLRVVEEKLISCNYEVTACQHAKIALSMLREKKDKFDLILTDVHMPDIDGFKLLELVGLELDLPVIMMSADREVKVAIKGLEHGARYYLMKPICFKELRNIWQHVARWKKAEPKKTEQVETAEDRKHNKAIVEEVEYDSSINERNHIQSKRKKEDEDGDRGDEEEENEDSANHNKKRLVWNTGLHSRFLKAIEQLGFDKAVPKKILEIMDVPGLKRENVASHLQKYRLYIRRLNDTKLSLSTSTGGSSSGAPKSRIRPALPRSTFDVQDKMAHANLSDHCDQMLTQPGWPAGNIQSFTAPMFTTSVNQMQVINQKTLNNFNSSMMASSTYNPPWIEGPTNLQQCYIQQRIKELSVGNGTSVNQMRISLPLLFNESIQMAHQQEEAQWGLLSSYQVDNLNMPNLQAHTDISGMIHEESLGVSNLAEDSRYTGWIMNSDCGLHGLTLPDPVVESSDEVNIKNIQMGEVSHGEGYANEGRTSSGRFANDNQTVDRSGDPVQQQNDSTRGDFQKAGDGDSFSLDMSKIPPFFASISFPPQFEESDTGDSLSKQQQGDMQFKETDFDIDFDIVSFHVDNGNGAE